MDGLSLADLVNLFVNGLQSQGKLDIALNIFHYVVIAVGVASIVVKALVEITKITPNTKDDEYAGKISVFVSGVVTLLSKIALNLPADKAHK